MTLLEKRYKGFFGLNLTFATLEGILKHSYPYKKSFLPKHIDESFNLETHPSIEAMVVDRADEIAYISHDIDDGINSGVISFEILKQSELVQTVLEKVYEENITEDDNEMFRYRFNSHLINHLVYALLDFSKKSVDNSSVLCATVEASSPIPIGFEPKLETQIKKLKKILFQNMYQHKDIVRKMFAGKQAIKGLYSALMSEEKMLPTYFYEQLHVRDKHRVVADFIASMSDREALKLHNEIYGRF